MVDTNSDLMIRCVVCGKKFPNPQMRLSPSKKGMVCQECGKREMAGRSALKNVHNL